MTKKFISLVLSLVLIIGLIPSTFAFAETVEAPEIIFTDNFENYNINEYLDDGDINNSDGTKKWSYGSCLTPKIVSMTGYDGKPTNALEITAASSGWPTDDTATPGQGRLTYIKSRALTSEGVLVMDFKIYKPEDENAISRFFMTPFSNFGGRISFGNSATNYRNRTFTTQSMQTGWQQITVVSNMETGVCYMYYNGEYLGRSTEYLASTSISKGASRFQFVPGDSKGKSIIIDDVNIYYSPVVVEPYSPFEDGVSVHITANPTVEFSEKILSITVDSVNTVSKANVTVVDSDGDFVAIESISATADCKSVIIQPESDFLEGETYIVTVSGLLDMYGRTINEYSFSFTTADETNITAAKPVFTKVDFEEGTKTEVDALENGLINASYTLKNNASSAKSVVMLAVLKDEDTIKRFQIKSETIPAGATVSFNGGFKVDNAATQKIEIFVWDNMCNMTPLAAKYAIDATGKTVVPN